MISRPSPAAMASKQGSIDAPFTKHCSPAAEVMPLVQKSNSHKQFLHSRRATCLTSMKGPGDAKRATELMPKYPQDKGLRMLMVIAFTGKGVSNMMDSAYATSDLAAACQHFASSKFEPSELVNILTSPGLYAQSIFTPNAWRREFNTPAQVTVCPAP